MRGLQTTNIVKPEWFGRNVSILLSNGKTIAGELSEVNAAYLVLETANGPTQVMVHAVVLIRLSEAGERDSG